MLIRLSSGEKLDSAIAEELLSRMSSSVDSELADYIDTLDDDEILEGVKSKYIQTPAQLEEYIRSLDSRLESMSSQELGDFIEDSESSVEPAAESSSE